MTQGRRFHFAAALFGDDYVERFLQAGLPSQLSPGNLPALAGGRPRYRLYTTAAEAEAVRRSPLFAALAELVEVSFHDLGPQVAAFRARACSAYDVMNFTYADSLKAAYADGGALIAIWPDVLFSDGCFRRLRELADLGFRGVATTGNQAAPTLVEAARARHLDPATGALVLPPRQLMALLLEHLTPYWTQFFADDPRFPSEEATHLQWRVGDTGILTRSSYFHPILAVPTEAACAFGSGQLWNGLDTTDFMATLSSDFEREIHVVRDSDEFCTVGLDPRASPFRDSPRRLNRLEMALALARTAHPRTRYFFCQSLQFHTGALDAAWAAREAEAQALAEDLLGVLDLLQARPGVRADLLTLQARGSQTPENEDLWNQVALRVEGWARTWRRDGRRVAVHGCGVWADRLLRETALGACQVVALVDSRPALQGTPFLRWTVQAPAGLPALAPDVVLVAALRAQEDIVAQLGALPGLGAEIQRLFPAAAAGRP